MEKLAYIVVTVTNEHFAVVDRSYVTILWVVNQPWICKIIWIH